MVKVVVPGKWICDFRGLSRKGRLSRSCVSPKRGAIFGTKIPGVRLLLRYFFLSFFCIFLFCTPPPRVYPTRFFHVRQPRMSKTLDNQVSVLCMSRLRDSSCPIACFLQVDSLYAEEDGALWTQRHHHKLVSHESRLSRLVFMGIATDSSCVYHVWEILLTASCR